MDCYNYQSSIQITIQKVGEVGGMEIILRGKAACVPWVIPKAHNLEEIMDDNKDWGSVAET